MRLLLWAWLALLPALSWPVLAQQAQQAQQVPLRVVTTDNMPPLIFRDAQGQLQGLQADRWRRWSEHTGVPVDLQGMAWADALQRFETGQADVIDGITITPERQQRLTFSEPWITLQVALFHHRDLVGIVDAATARGFVVGVRRGDACEGVLNAASLNSLALFDSYDELMAGVAGGDVRVFCGHVQLVSYYLGRQGLGDEFRHTPPLYQATGHWAVKKADAARFEQVSAGFASLPAQDLADIDRRWVGAALATPQADPFLVRHGRTLWLVLAITLAVVLVLVFWLWSLRKVVALRTADLEAASAALHERVKERDCLNAVFRATEDLAQPWPEVCRAVVRLLPAGWQFPQLVVARLTLDGQTYRAGVQGQPVLLQHADVVVDGQGVGTFTVGYVQPSEPAPQIYAFLPEEQALLTAIAQRLADVCTRRQAEQRIRDSEARFRSLFEGSPQATLIIRDGLFEAANPAAVRLFGMQDAQQFLGRSPIHLSPTVQPGGESSQVKARNLMALAMAQGSQTFEWVHQRTDGQLFTARVALTAIHENDHDILHVVIGDITAQKQAEADVQRYREGLERLVEARTAELQATASSLRDRTEEQDAILHAASAGIVLVRERRIVRCNPGLESLLGYGAGELLGQSTSVFYSDDDTWSQAEAQQYQAVVRGQTHVHDQQARRHDGSQVWVRLSARAIDPGQPEQGLVLIVEDITRERQVLAEMSRARALAEEAARTKSDFLANMSHEIRTPMNAIMGMAHLLQRTPLNDKQRDQLGKIQSASHHLLGIINDILDFSKIEAGKLVIEDIDFNLETVLREVTSFITERAQAKGLELILDMAPDVPIHFRGDPLRISQILTNYASNAVKFSEHGNITLRSRLEKRQGAQVWLRFEVQDQGIGLDEDQRQRLFRSFEQADTSTTRRFGGTGLGLAISKKLAELMGGTVGVDSTLGQGSTFWFTVRLTEGHAAVVPLVPTPDLRGRRVLVVDDNDSARQVLTEQLISMSFDAMAVHNGQAAVDAVQQAEAEGRPYDIVFMDWQMPVLNGVDAAAHIRQLPLAKPPHVVLVTAYGKDEPTVQAREAGIEDVLIKPVTASLLLDTAMHLLHRELSQSPPPALASPAQDMSVVAGARILLVEDNLLNQEVARELLTEAGLVVDVADNGAIALAMVQQRPYQLVLMDMQMPVMDGLAATRAIRALPGFQALPILAMTANAMAGDRQRCLDAGMNDHIAKPIEPERLWQVLLHWLPHAAATAASAPAGQDDDAKAPGPPFAAESTPPPTPASPAPALASAALPQVPGLDTATGLRLASGRPGLYLSLLRRFLESNADFEHQLGLALSSGDQVLAQRLAHTLKGAAGQVGALELQAAAQALESLLAQEVVETEAVRAAMHTTVQALQPVRAGLQVALHGSPGAPGAAPEPTSVPAGPALAADEWQALWTTLRNGDASALAWVDGHADALCRELPQHHDQLLEAVRNFDFDQALQVLQAAGVTAPPAQA